MIIDYPKIKDIPDLLELWKEAFGDSDEFVKTFFSTAFSPKRSRRISLDGITAAALYWFDCTYNGKRIAYVYAVATAKAYRGQGLCHILMNDTHTMLKSQGYTGAILVPGSKELFDFYHRMGYKTCAYVNEIKYKKSERKVKISKIGKEEYAKLRRQHLPEGGVLQEGENLDFLERYASFYAGRDFVLATLEEKDIMHGIELLGNVSSAPDIVGTLGYKSGNFRAPGKETPFAMYYPFEKNKSAPPTYFGLAFD